VAGLPRCRDAFASSKSAGSSVRLLTWKLIGCYNRSLGYSHNVTCAVEDRGPARLDECLAVLPMPVLEWTEVVLAEDPTRSATRERLRQLQKKHLVGHGVKVTKRDDRGLSGSGTYFSVLTALAAKSRHEGSAEDAEYLLGAAGDLEDRFADELRNYLSQCSLDELPKADFFGALASETAGHVSWWTKRSKALLAVALVKENAADLAHLAGHSASGDPVDLDVPLKLLERQSLVSGDHVWVFSRIVQSAALVEVLRATTVPCNLLESLEGFALVMHHPRSQVGSDGLTDDERAVFAERWKSGVAADLTSGELTKLRSDLRHGHLPTRRIRPAG
jgi:hypothetical protein